MTALERWLFKAGAALRATSKEKEAELGRVEAELRKASEGRIWARVHEAEAKRKQAETKVAGLEKEVDELLCEKRKRVQHVRVACLAPPSSTLASAIARETYRTRDLVLVTIILVSAVIYNLAAKFIGAHAARARCPPPLLHTMPARTTEVARRSSQGAARGLLAPPLYSLHCTPCDGGGAILSLINPP